jgi:hypothetical protein
LGLSLKTPITAGSEKDYQLLAHGRWFSSGNPASSTINTGRHNLAEILLKVTLNSLCTGKQPYFLHPTHLIYSLCTGKQPYCLHPAPIIYSPSTGKQPYFLHQIHLIYSPCTGKQPYCLHPTYLIVFD